MKVLMPSRGGFTLIEVMLVLAITGALLATVFAGQAQLRAGIGFSSDIEKIANNISGVRSQALTAVSNGDGTSTTQVVGQELKFDPVVPTQLAVNTLLYIPNPVDPTDPEVATINNAGGSNNINLPGGIEYAGAQSKVYFERAPLTGELLTFITNSAIPFLFSSPTSYIKGSTANITIGKYLFQDRSHTRFACLTVNPSDGTVTTEINPSVSSTCHF